MIIKIPSSHKSISDAGVVKTHIYIVADFVRHLFQVTVFDLHRLLLQLCGHRTVPDRRLSLPGTTVIPLPVAAVHPNTG